MERSGTKKLLTAHNVWLTSAIVIVVALGVYSGMDAEAFRAAADSAAKSRVAMQTTQRVLSLLKDAESGQRGYLLTGDPQYLNAYNQALREIEKRVRDLNAVVGPC